MKDKKVYIISEIHSEDSYHNDGILGTKVIPEKNFETRGLEDIFTGWSHRDVLAIDGKYEGQNLYFFAVKLKRKENKR
jgi:hypothetical protein